jgi:rhodanese-related sulfurtransferase
MTRRPLTVEELLADARQGLERLTPQQAGAAMADGAILVDIRSDAQRARDGILPGAIHVPRNVLEWRADCSSPHREPALGGPQARLMLICHEGYQSSLAAATLQRLGRDATDVIGGYVEWRAAGLPLAPPPDV